MGGGALSIRALIGLDLSDPVQSARFREKGGAHETVCQKLVADVCRHLSENL